MTSDNPMTLNLVKYRSKFKTPEEFNEFVKELESAAGVGTLILNGDDLLGAMISKEEAGERLRKQIVKRIAAKPEILDILQARLESEDLVE